MEDAPPSYNAATSSTSAEGQKNTNNSSAIPHQVRNGIPIHSRRSMEDEARPLPDGWVRQYDDKQHHQFFVDTRANPPRSIWQHPYDDQQYLSSLDPKERTRLQENHLVPSHADIVAESSDEDDHHYHGKDQELPPRPEQEPTGLSKFGRKMKDKLTNTTHEQREAERKKRAEEEQRLFERHQKIRAAMVKAAQTGKPQLIGKDKDGKDVYIEPPVDDGYDSGYGGGYPGYGYSQGGYGYNPYTQGPYSSSRYAPPSSAYSRPYYGGYGGGLGLPIGLGLGGGLLMGDMMMGGMGGMGGMGMMGGGMGGGMMGGGMW